VLCVLCAVLCVVQAWEQQLQQTQKAWKAMHHRLAAVIAAAEQQRRQREQEQAAGTPLGVRGLAASRAQGRQVRWVCQLNMLWKHWFIVQCSAFGVCFGIP
jgi:hypothetical protein